MFGSTIITDGRTDCTGRLRTSLNSAILSPCRTLAVAHPLKEPEYPDVKPGVFVLWYNKIEQ